MLGNYGVAAQLVASQVVLSSTELVNLLTKILFGRSRMLLDIDVSCGQDDVAYIYIYVEFIHR
jgi:hypothetical protein